MNKTIVSFLCIFLISSSVFAGIEEDLAKLQIKGLDEETQSRIEAIKERHGGSFIRPEACPMASKNYKDILAKIESIRSLFKDPSCLGDETSLEQTYNDLVETSTGIQEQLSTLGVEGEQSMPVNGAAINSLFSGLNTLFFQNSCELIDKNVLEQGADFAQNFAQLGLLMPNNNGITITGGGLALSGILKLINNLFTKKFNFENNSERRSFIKLNCAFYDIRRDIEKSGLVEIALPEHREDLGELKKIVETNSATIKANLEAKAKQIELIEKREAEHTAKQSESVLALEKNMQKALNLVNQKVTESEGGKKPAETVKREILSQLVSLRADLSLQLENYFALGLSPATIFDMDLAQELSKLDLSMGQEAFMALYKMPPQEFNNTYRASLLFHFERVLSDIGNLKGEIKTKWRENTEIQGLKVNDYILALNKELEAKKKVIEEANKALQPISERLERIVGGDSGYTRNDDGTENKTAILSAYDEIANQVYGKWGYEFLKYTTKTAEEENDAFSQKFTEFANNHLAISERKYVIKEPNQLDDLRILYACQDAKPYIRRYAEADSLVQQAYDFVVTNKELFHSDHDEPFLSDLTRVRSVFEKIQDHHKSSIYALKLMRGEEVPASAKERYLGDKAKRREYLGTVMIKVNNSKPKAQMLQGLLDRYDCNRLTSLDD